MVKSKILFFIILITISIINNKENVKIINEKKKFSQITVEKKENDNIGKIIIKKININNSLYKIGSKKNNIEENITILDESIMPDIENSILFIAAHSGTGNIAYFNDLDKLEKKDEIIIVYNNKKYYYIVKDIWEERKNGYININKENKKQLVLTTCSPNKKNYQLIINCIEKES